MSAPAKAKAIKAARKEFARQFRIATRNGQACPDIHLPSVHFRKDGRQVDYMEDLSVRGRGRGRRFDRIVRLGVVVDGEVVLARQTADTLCPEEQEWFEATLPALMDESDEDAQAFMEERARKELAHQLRIAAGYEQTCARCGCSETRVCSGGCLWVTATICSR